MGRPSAERASVGLLADERDCSRPEARREAAQALDAAGEVRTAEIRRPTCRPERGVRQPEPVADQGLLLLGRHETRGEVGGVEQPPEVVARVREVRPASVGVETRVDPAEDHVEAGREHVRNSAIAHLAGQCKQVKGLKRRDARGDKEQMGLRAARRPSAKDARAGWRGALRSQPDLFRAAFENAPTGVALLTPGRRFSHVNRALCELLGYSADQLTKLTMADVLHPDDPTPVLDERALDEDVWHRRAERRFVRADGRDVWALVTKELVRDEHGLPLYLVAHVEDVTNARDTARALREAEERFRRAFDDSPIGMALVALDGRFLRVNRTLCEITGFATDELLARTFQEITHPDDVEQDVALTEDAVSGAIRTYRMEKRYVRADGSIIWVKLSVTLVRDDDERPLYFVSEIEDIAERKRTQLELQRLANFDVLTGLGNRRKLTNDLEHALHEPSEAHPHVLVILDLNGFKPYNDTFGHPAGDALLRRLAGKLAEAAQPHGDAYRLGGDEFCVLGSPPAEAVAAYVDSSVRALDEEGSGFCVSACFGVAVLPEEAATPSGALTIADRKLYAHKHLHQTERDRPHEALLRALQEREPALGEHCSGVAALAVAVGGRLGFAARDLDELRRAAELHDIGKLAMPDGVLAKRGPLTSREWALMRQHTLIGERILTASPALGSLGRIVRSTHERWDGTGYPDGLTGDAIPQASRIIAVCDAYMAMAADRPYQRARSGTRSLAELRAGAGTQFDPAVVAAISAEVGEPARGVSSLSG